LDYIIMIGNVNIEFDPILWHDGAFAEERNHLFHKGEAEFSEEGFQPIVQ